METNICKALSLAGVNVTPEQLHLYHCLKKTKPSSEVTQLRFFGKSFRCHQLTAGKIHSTWFFNNTVELNIIKSAVLVILRSSWELIIEKNMKTVLLFNVFSISSALVIKVDNIVIVIIIFQVKLDLIHLI